MNNEYTSVDANRLLEVEGDVSKELGEKEKHQQDDSSL